VPNYSSRYETERHRLLSGLIPRGDGLAADIGCNDGAYTELLSDAGYRAVGFDIDDDVLERARVAHPALDFRKGSAADAKDLGARRATVCLEVVEHLTASAQAALLADISEATAPGGWLLISTPGRHSAMSVYERARSRSWRQYDWWDSTHVNVVSARRFRALVTSAGFDIERFIGYYYLPEQRARPASFEGPLARLGFDLVVLARRTNTVAAVA
jgi:2-polyprenyl-3-methyl-5-hydroxy-6-metoxy-1,4-benzoquinol methylase